MHRLKDSIESMILIEFFSFVRIPGGTSEEIFTNSELTPVFVSVLRANFQILENYENMERERKIPCNISIFGGMDDTRLLAERKKMWPEYTTGECLLYEFNGAHFYLFEESV